MPVRAIARDLYRLQREVERIERDLNSCSLLHREALKEQWRKAKAERDRVKGILEGAKGEPSYRKAK